MVWYFKINDFSRKLKFEENKFLIVLNNFAIHQANFAEYLFGFINFFILRLIDMSLMDSKYVCMTQKKIFLAQPMIKR